MVPNLNLVMGAFLSMRAQCCSGLWCDVHKGHRVYIIKGQHAPPPKNHLPWPAWSKVSTSTSSNWVIHGFWYATKYPMHVWHQYLGPSHCLLWQDEFLLNWVPYTVLWDHWVVAIGLKYINAKQNGTCDKTPSDFILLTTQRWTICMSLNQNFYLLGSEWGI